MKISEYKEFAIKKSHERCKKLNLTHDQVYSNKIFNRDKLQKKFAENRELIITANPFIKKLCDFVKGSNFFTLLTDGEGCILNAIGDEDILSEAFRMKMIPGAFMNEESIGTNAMSMVLVEEKPIQISGDDHYIKAYHKWTCSAAPIKDIYGNIIGVINLTGYIESVHLHTLGMVVSASNAIEEMLKMKKNNDMINFTNKHIQGMFDSIKTGIITSNIDGQITTLNKQAIKMFGYKESVMKNMNIFDIIYNFNEIKISLFKGKEFKNNNVYINSKNNKLKLNLTAYSFYNSSEDAVEIIFIFQEKKLDLGIEDRLINGKAIYTFDKIIGKSDNFSRIIDYAKKISNSKSTILIMGESGTGKELFAQSIHNNSIRMDEKFIAVNCGAIPRELIESELFGYKEGAFTGAKRGGYPGKFQMANGGTIFLDEIGEMPLDMQTKILRVIEDGVINKLGSTKPDIVNVRIIAATNKDLKKEVEEGNFRKDLYYRLNVLPIYIPPLRERKEDIPRLVDHFMEKISNKLNKKQVKISKDQMENFINYSWPGNVRELENIVELIINTEMVPDNLFSTTDRYNKNNVVNIKEESLRLEDVERQHIIKVLTKYEGNITRAASALGIGRNTLYCKLDKYNIRKLGSCFKRA